MPGAGHVRRGVRSRRGRAGRGAADSGRFAGRQFDDAAGDDQEAVVGHLGDPAVGFAEAVGEEPADLGHRVYPEADLLRHHDGVAPPAPQRLDEPVDVGSGDVVGDPRPEGVEEDEAVQAGQHRRYRPGFLDGGPRGRAAGPVPGHPVGEVVVAGGHEAGGQVCAGPRPGQLFGHLRLAGSHAAEHECDHRARSDGNAQRSLTSTRLLRVGPLRQSGLLAPGSRLPHRLPGRSQWLFPSRRSSFPMPVGRRWGSSPVTVAGQRRSRTGLP